MFKGKLRKLIKKPGLFFSDMAANQLRKLGKVYVKKVEGHYQYTVVSAVYNVGRYLDDFFASIVRQKLNFKKHIHLVMVDDGSTDDSAFIIKKWQKNTLLTLPISTRRMLGSRAPEILAYSTLKVNG